MSYESVLYHLSEFYKINSLNILNCETNLFTSFSIQKRLLNYEPTQHS